MQRRWAALLGAVLLCACDPRPYRSGSDSSDDEDTDVETTADWLEMTFGGIYQLYSYHVSEGSCSAGGVNRRNEAGEFFWVHAVEGSPSVAEMCVCGETIEECQRFADAVEGGELLRCVLQRTVTDRIDEQIASQRVDIPGTWDGANNCLQGGTESVTFERSGSQMEIDHRLTLTDYVVTDGQCTPARARTAAGALACSTRDLITGTLITE